MKNLIKIKTLAVIFAVVAIGTAGTILLVKNFESKEYTIAFDSNGGSTVDSLTIKEDETINEPSMPTKEGYIFEGWYYNGEKFDFSTKVTKDMTLEARWQIENNGDLIVDAKELNLIVGASKQVKTTLTGNLKDTKLIWKSSDEKIATVDKNGNVKGLKSGKANITVTTEDGSKKESITINVTEPVKDEPTIKPDDTSKNDSTDKTVAVSSVSITNLTGENQVYAGETIDLKAIINPSDAVNKDVTWTVDKEDLGKVATDGLNATLITKAKGVVKVTVTTADGGKTATIEIEII